MINADTILKDRVITEKSTLLSECHNQYTFRVYPSANRTSVAQAVEKTFSVKVLAVRILKVKPKPFRTRRGIRGYKSGCKKAIVTLAPDNSIDD